VEAVEALSDGIPPIARSESFAAFISELERLVPEVMEEWKVPGPTVAVVQNGEMAFVRPYGLRDVEADLKVTADTQFQLMSVAKSFTATGLALLVDERRMDWKKPVREYIPEFRLHDVVASDRVTVRDLLCHHSGLPGRDWIWRPGDLLPAQMLAAMRYLESSDDIRTTFQYSNLGYLVASMVTERVSGQSWTEFTRARHEYVDYELRELTLTFGNQPTYKLRPYRSRTFVIGEFEDFRVEFRRGHDGDVDELDFQQPNGSFLSRRV
jgi:CubicO group peptidase (beta-lactamase class C family)